MGHIEILQHVVLYIPKYHHVQFHHISQARVWIWNVFPRMWCAVILKLQGFYALLFYNSNFLLNPTTATMIIVALPLMKNHRANLGNIQCSNSSSTLWSYLWQLSSSAAMIMIGQEMSFKSRIDLMINTSSARLLSDQSHLSMVMIKIVHFLWIGVFLSLWWICSSF